MIETHHLKTLGNKYRHSIDCLALIADLNILLKEEVEANETLKRLQSEVNELKKIVSN